MSVQLEPPLSESEEQQELEVITTSIWWVPIDWKIVDGEIQLPDGRTMKFWPEIELVDDNKPELEVFKVLEWGEAGRLVGIIYDESESKVTLRPIKEP